jgi:hypothetical protein
MSDLPSGRHFFPFFVEMYFGQYNYASLDFILGKRRKGGVYEVNTGLVVIGINQVP